MLRRSLARALGYLRLTPVAAVAVLAAASLGSPPSNPPPAAAQSAGPWLVSRAPGGGSASGASDAAAISADGRWVAFASEAADLVPGDGNGAGDVFLWQRPSGPVTRVSLTAAGTEAAARSQMPALSADGRWLAFRSDGALTADDAPSGGLYVRDLATGGMRLVAADSRDRRGTHSFPAVSGDGGRVVFESTAALSGAPADGQSRVFWWDRATGAIRPASPVGADAPARQPAISRDGMAAAFVSEATNLAVAPPSSGDQVYVVTLATGTVERASVATNGAAGGGASMEPALSGDGRLVAFTSLAADLVAKDVNGVSDIFVRDRAAGTTIAVTDVTPDDNVHHPGHSREPDLSADGRWLAFASEMYTLTPGDTNRVRDVYVHDLATRATRLVSRRADGSQSDQRSWGPALASDGGHVAFTAAGPLVAADSGDTSDVYLVSLNGAPHPPQATATHPPPHPTATPTAHPPHPSPTPTGHHPHPTATSSHDPTATPQHHPPPTATPTGHHAHPTATSPHHPPPTGTAAVQAPASGTWLVYLPRLVSGP